MAPWGKSCTLLILGLTFFMTDLAVSLEDLVIPHPAEGEELCVASGDPHIHTFDDVKYEFHGQCDYTLVTNCDDSLLPFEIIGEFRRLQFPNNHVSVIKALRLVCPDQEVEGNIQIVELNEHFGVRISTIEGETTTSQTTMTTETMAINCGNIKRYNNGVVLTLNNGLTVYWSSPYRVTIIISDVEAAALSNNLCGCCGNENDIKYDDFKTSSGALVADVIEFGDSWRTKEDCATCDDCDHDSICRVNHGNEQQAIEKCSVFINGDLPNGGDAARRLDCERILCATLPEKERFCQMIHNYNMELVLAGLPPIDVSGDCEGSGGDPPPADAPVEDPKPKGCTDDKNDGATYNEGEIWNLDSCTWCSCNKGKIDCKTAACVPVDCVNKETPEGECCEQCVEGCVDPDGFAYTEGQNVNTDEPCISCSCQNGEIVCIPTRQGETVEAGDPCASCYCVDGLVTCEPVACSVTCVGCTAEGAMCATTGELLSDGCCDEYKCMCVDPDGVKYTDGQNIVTDAQCVSCNCQANGAIVCTPIRQGETVDTDVACQSCHCDNGGVICSTPGCPQPCADCSEGASCVTTGPPAGVCCEEFECACVDSNGVKYTEGQIVDTGESCKLCNCQANGEIVCIPTREGETVETGDPCASCYCGEGLVTCEPVACSVTCVGCTAEGAMCATTGELLSDGCCDEYKCMCVDSNGVKYTDGQIVDTGESCKLCNCQANGEIVCIPTREGETVEAGDPCASCYCVDGLVTCEPVACSVTCVGCTAEGAMCATTGELLSDGCCDEYKCMCVDSNGVKYTDGQIVDTGESCKSCSCQSNGEIVCTPIRQGETVDTDVACQTCHCENGGVICSTPGCPQPCADCSEGASCVTTGPPAGVCCEEFECGGGPCDDPSLCAHGGTCVNDDSESGFTCTCVEPWFGKRCRKGKCDEDPLLCKNDAECVNKDLSVDSNGFKCICKDKWIGKRCGKSECDRNPEVELCANDGVCKYANNTQGFICKCRNGWSGKTCEKGNMICQASGDPHYIQFNGIRFNFQGRCEYILIQTDNVTVTVNNEMSTRNAKVSITKSVTITFKNGQTIYLERHGVVKIDDEKVCLPESTEDYTARRRGDYILVKIKTIYGRIVIKWNGRSTVIVRVPRSFEGQIDGLCGISTDPDSRFMDLDGNVAANAKDFGDSWVSNPGDCEACSQDECPSADPCDSATTDIVDDANNNCGIIQAGSVTKRSLMELNSMGAYVRKKRETDDTPFATCHGTVSFPDYFDNCKSDWCAVQDTDTLCEDIADYAEECQSNGVAIGNWRSSVPGCEFQCPENSQYSSTASACPSTCAEPNADQACEEFSSEGCVCNEGFMLEDNKCIPRADCGCFSKAGRYFAKGAVRRNKLCTKECVCKPEGVSEDQLNDRDLQCNAIECGADDICAVRDGVRDCYLNGCLWNSITLPLGIVRFDTADCSTGGKCKLNGELVNNVPACDANARCVETNQAGIYRCKCRVAQGYSGNGITCEFTAR